MIQAFLLFILTAWAGSLAGRDIKIGLYQGSDIQSLVVSVTGGNYSLTAGGLKVVTLSRGSILHIDISETGLNVHDMVTSYGPFASVALVPSDSDGVFMLRPVFPAMKPKESDDRLDLRIENSYIRMVNTLDMEKYIAGTVESEGGPGALPEYYKAQAVIARTFAVRNFYRHAHQGFNMCDDVHCQAYNGKSRMSRAILTAVEATENEILTDRQGQPAVTAYHASCGGLTASASVEWNRDLEYLVPVRDPFCNRSKNLNWSRSIPAGEWNVYLASAGYTGTKESIFYASTVRLKFLDTVLNALPLTEIRRHFNLKSSWFHIENEGDQVIFRGHGYGHGLGMCQEGAMEMARVGYTFTDILMFYFKGLELRVSKPTE